MGFVRFDFDVGEALVWVDTSSEDGWCFTFDAKAGCFNVWSSSESRALNFKPDRVYSTLEEVLTYIKTIT